MTQDQVMYALMRCEAALRGKYPNVEAVRHQGGGTKPEHVAWMCEETRALPKQKAHRWLGFIQGYLWADGIATIDEMRVWNTHEPKPTDKEESKKMDCMYAKKEPAVTSIRNLADELAAALSIAITLGMDGDKAISAAAMVIENTKGVNLYDLLGIPDPKDPEPKDQEPKAIGRVMVTEVDIARNMGLSIYAVRNLLHRHGYLRRGEVTTKGRQFVPPNSNTKGVIEWYAEVLNALQEDIDGTEPETRSCLSVEDIALELQVSAEYTQSLLVKHGYLTPHGKTTEKGKRFLWDRGGNGLVFIPEIVPALSTAWGEASG